MSAVMTRPYQIAMITAWIASLAPDGLEVGLHTNESLALDPQLTVEDLTPATGTWAAKKAGTLQEVADAGGQRAKISLASCTFDWAAAGGATPQTVYGYVIYNAADDTVVAVGNLPEPKEMSNTLDQISFIPEIIIPPFSAV